MVTSLQIFADMVRNVGGDRVEVEALLPSGADPHTFELAPGGVQTIAEADIIFINGLDLEHSLEDPISTNAGGPVIELVDGLPVLQDTQEYTEEEEEEADEEQGHEGEDAAGNPHMWLDPQRATSYVERIRDELIALDPAASAEYQANAQNYLGELEALDQDVEDALASIPDSNRKLVSSHDAYPYLARRYGLEVVGVVVTSPGQEPSAADIAGLTATLERENVPAVFKEPQFNSDILKAAADDAGVRVLDLLSDAYVEGVDSYIELMEFNLRQLVEGLGGTDPQNGGTSEP